jgi:dipeptide/tripeptide permease
VRRDASKFVYMSSTTDSVRIYIFGSFAMLFTSLPPALDHGAGIPGIAIAMIFIGIGVGGIKATVNAFIGEFERPGNGIISVLPSNSSTR